jgi:two-component SAPR family response regulator
MEALWPGQPLGSARNSLHQTLHFIRRYVDPWHTEGLNVDYVTLEGDMIYLDSALVHVDSVSFLRQANDIIKGGSPVRDGPGLLGMYLGRFAPEFEYDDWAEDWRTLVHATYLHLAQSTADGLVDQGRDHEAIQLLTRAVELDGRALELMGRLVRLHHRLGATDAASTTYRRYAALMRREYGVRPPTLRALIGQQPVVVATS